MEEEKIIKIGGAKASSREAVAEETTKSAPKAKKTSTTKKTSTSKTTKTAKTKASTNSTTKSKTTKSTKAKKDIKIEAPEDMTLDLNTNVSIGSDGNLDVPFEIEEDETKAVVDIPVETPELIPEKEEVKKDEGVMTVKEDPNGLKPMDDIEEESKRVRTVVTAGDRNCYLYFNMKMTSTTKTGEPVSLGIMDANRNIFYAEFSGYTVPQMNPEFLAIMNGLTNANPGTLTSARNRFMRGTYAEVGEALREWLKVYYEEENVNVQFMSDKLINEGPVLYDLILDGKEMSERPKYLSPVIMDLNSELAHVTSKPTDLPVDNYVPAMFLAVNVPLTMVCGNDVYMWKENSEGLLNKTIDNSLAYAAMIKTTHQGLWGIEEKTITDVDIVQ